jgi:hypothetical protein
MISTHFAEPYRLRERELRLMDLLARQSADYLERHAKERTLREHARAHALLSDIAEISMRSPRTGETIKWIAERVAHEFKATRCGIALIDTERGIIAIADDYHGELPSLAGEYPMTTYTNHLKADGHEGRVSVMDLC